MKLEYVYYNNSNLKRIIFFSLLLVVFGFSFWVCRGYLEYGLDIIDDKFYLLVGLAICLLIFIVYGMIPFFLYFFVNLKNRRDSEKIKKNGIRKRGYIYACYSTYGNKSVCYSRRGYNSPIYTSRYVMLVKVENDSYLIDWISNNKACKLLIKLLSEYDEKRAKLCSGLDYLQFRNIEEIYIDVYFYDDKIHGDLESIDMVKIKEKTDI